VLAVLSRLVPGSLRAQLALAIAVVTAIAVGASFLAVYTGTSSRLQAQIDSGLRAQLAEWRQLIARADLSTPQSLTRVAAKFIAGQRYHAESQLIVVQVAGGATVSNDAELVAAERTRERTLPEATGLLQAPSGLATASVAEAGRMRALSTPIEFRGRQVGTLRVANPLTPVQQAQASLQRAFVIVGAFALLAAIAAGIGLATLIAAPLRRIASVAAAAGTGELSARAGPVAGRGEVGVLARAFDQMLDQLQGAFTRQRNFVSDASHELRTPLAVLRAQVELLDRESDEQRRREGTRTLLLRLDQLDRLVGDMLTLASAQAGQLIELRSVDLGEFFEDLRRDLPLFGQRDFRVQAVGGTLTADPDRLTQVMRNLVRNAVSQTRPGDRIVIAARGDGSRLEMTVSDSGPGIPPDRLEQIFERFSRLDGGRARDAGGSGLGLAIARAIAEAHGGTLRAESRPGQGATFRLVLPGYRPDHVGAANATCRYTAPATRSPSEVDTAR
jgi:signal transduction histidine kinase